MNSVKRLVLFDLDHTLLPLDSDYQWADFLARNGYVGNPDEALRRNDELMDRYNAGNLSAAESYAFMLGLLTLADIPTLKQWHASYMEAIIRPAITPAAVDLIKHHTRQNDLCAIVTATNEFVTAPIAQAFQIDHLVATIPEIVNGRYTGHVLGTPSYQEGKIHRVHDWLEGLGKQFDEFDETWFYSDSINDLPLMDVVSHPVAANPSPALRQTAQGRGWPIMDLFDDMLDTKS